MSNLQQALIDVGYQPSRRNISKQDREQRLLKRLARAAIFPITKPRKIEVQRAGGFVRVCYQGKPEECFWLHRRRSGATVEPHLSGCVRVGKEALVNGCASRFSLLSKSSFNSRMSELNFAWSFSNCICRHNASIFSVSAGVMGVPFWVDLKKLYSRWEYKSPPNSATRA